MRKTSTLTLASTLTLTLALTLASACKSTPLPSPTPTPTPPPTLTAPPPTPTQLRPTPSPASPLPTPPTSPLSTPVAFALQAASTVITRQMSLHWDAPSVPAGEGHRTLIYTSTESIPNWRYFADLELRQEGQIIAAQTLDTGITYTTTLGEGQYGEPFAWEWSSVFYGVAKEWVRGRWSAPGQESFFGIYVPPEGQQTEQDDAGYWFTGDVAGADYRTYFPIICAP